MTLPDRPTASRGFTLLELLFVALIVATVVAIAIPMAGNTIGNARLSGDARGVTNDVAVAKMRAASDFTHARLYVDLAGNSHHVDSYVKTGTPGWLARTGPTYLSGGVSFNYGSLAAPPTGTQGTIGQAPPCLDNSGNAIANTACIVFNSRGTPIDSFGAATTADAVYLTDGTAVYGATVLVSGMIQLWRSSPTSASWAKQ
jgi:prepilin-type N-terminal cleavage/methylation domain-containing protein